MMTKASYAYPAVRLSDAEARIRLDVYATGLSDLPADLLGVAFLEAVRTIKFFPSVAELRALAEAEAIRRRRAYLASLPPPPPPAPEPQLSPAEKAEVSRMLKDTIRQLSAGAP